MKMLIIAGGRLEDQFLLDFVKGHKIDQTIVVDGALEQVDRWKIPFQYLVGDFDTVDPKILKRYENQPQFYVERHVPEKNETDSELAMQVAFSKKPEIIYFLGATGRRMDHTLGNIGLLYQAMQRNIICYIYDEYNRISLIQSKKQFLKSECYGTYLSFLPFFYMASDVTLTGFKYPLTHAALYKESTLAISNELQEEVGMVTVGDGILLCIEALDKKRSGY